MNCCSLWQRGDWGWGNPWWERISNSSHGEYKKDAHAESQASYRSAVAPTQGRMGYLRLREMKGPSTASPQRLSTPTKKYFSHCDREYMYSKLKQEFHKKYFRQLLMMPYAYFLFYSLPFHVFNTSGNSLNCFLNPLMGSIPQLENNDPDQLPHFAEKTKLR